MDWGSFWRAFNRWHNEADRKMTGDGWPSQKRQIEKLVEAQTRRRLAWKTLWAEFDRWYRGAARTMYRNCDWAAQQRKIKELVEARLNG